MDECFVGLIFVLGFWTGWTLFYLFKEQLRKELDKIWDDIFKKEEH